MGSQSQARNWCLTISLEHVSLLELRTALEGLHCSYAIWQLELGDTTGFPHWQVYCEFGRGIRFDTLKRSLPTAHCERRYATRDQARDYCRKEATAIDGPWEIGTWVDSQPGRRTDIEELHAAVIGGAPTPELWSEFPSMLRYYRGVAAMQNALPGPRPPGAPTVYVLWGPTGTGKSARCAAMAPEAYRVPQPATNNQPVWFDGYQGQSDVIFDDFYGWVKFSKLLVLLDRYPTLVDYRGGSAPWMASRVFFTSNVSPENWYRNMPAERYAALARRFTLVVEITSLDQVLPAPFDTFDPTFGAAVAPLP